MTESVRWQQGLALMQRRRQAANAERMSRTQLANLLSASGASREHPGLTVRHVLVMLAIGPPFADDAFVPEEALPHQANISDSTRYLQAHLSKTPHQELAQRFGFVEVFYDHRHGSLPANKPVPLEPVLAEAR